MNLPWHLFTLKNVDINSRILLMLMIFLLLKFRVPLSRLFKNFKDIISHSYFNAPKYINWNLSNFLNLLFNYTSNLFCASVGAASQLLWDVLMLLKCELLILKSKINTQKSSIIVLGNWQFKIIETKYKIPHPSPCRSKDVQRLCVGQVQPKGSTSCT